MKRDILLAFAVFAMAAGMITASVFTSGGASAWFTFGGLVLCGAALVFSWIQELGEVEVQRQRAAQHQRNEAIRTLQRNEARALVFALASQIEEAKK